MIEWSDREPRRDRDPFDDVDQELERIRRQRRLPLRLKVMAAIPWVGLAVAAWGIWG